MNSGIILAQYKIKKIVRESESDIVYRGTKDSGSGKDTYLLNVIKKNRLKHVSVAYLKVEFEKIRRIRSGNVIEIYEMTETPEEIIIVTEDFNGISIKSFLEHGQIGTGTLLTIAAQLASALSEIHKKGVVHMDVRPQNIFIDQEGGCVKLGNFAALHSVINEKKLYDREFIRERLPYLSPEQTGRMNRLCDYRTDFYSLGVTLYEMFTGIVPCKSGDPLEIIHFHIAKQPIAPGDVRSEIPPIVSDMIMKLLSKSADERYQSGAGLEADLKQCLELLNEYGAIGNFILGARDRSERFQIPQKLYGRDNEIAELMSAFERITRGAAEVLLVSGNPGIGKTALVREINKPITGEKGYFISGKYDQLQKDTPYTAIVHAFQGLMRQILTESEESVSIWQGLLIKALGVSGQILIDVIPEIETIIGKQPAVVQLGPTESQNRFNRIFQEFVKVFTLRKQPLALFLDDLQWADLASLNLVKTLITDPGIKYFFIIGAYRDNEVNASHPFMHMKDDILDKGTAVHTIELGGLRLDDVTSIVSETFHCETKQSLPLASLIYQKTGGNPFFVNQFLYNLNEEEMVSRDAAFQWKWDMERIYSVKASDSVIDLMVKRITRLTTQTQQVLKLAACIGNQFDLNIVTAIQKGSATEVYDYLSEAVQEGLILISENGYVFLHDRIQEAAYTLIPSADKDGLHYKIGNLILNELHSDKIGEKVFTVVDHLNHGINLISDQAERINLAGLNLEAGRKAKASTAYASAAKYLTAGMKLLPEDRWRSRYETTFALYMERSECEYLSGNFEDAENFFLEILQNTKTCREKAMVYKLKVLLYQSRGRFQESLTYGIEGLKLLGFRMPAETGNLGVLLEIIKIKFYIGSKNMEDLLHLPEMTDPDKKLIMDIMVNIAPAAYFVNKNIFSLNMLKMSTLSLRHGLTGSSTAAFSIYGMILGIAFGNYKAGYDLGQMALKYGERFNNLNTQCLSNFTFGSFINHWRSPLKSAVKFLVKGYVAGTESGNFLYAGYCAGVHIVTMTFKGDKLDDVNEQCDVYIDILTKMKHEDMLSAVTIIRQATLSLKGLTGSPPGFSDSGFDEDSHVDELRKKKKQFLVCIYQIFKIYVSYLLGRYDVALKMAEELERHKDHLLGMIYMAEHNFYYSLTLTALYSDKDEKEKKRRWKILKRNQRQMKKWADNCPENFLNKYLLVAAEMERIKGDDLMVEKLYVRAIEAARENRFIQEEATACELYAKFNLSRGAKSDAAVYMKKTYFLCRSWGAAAKEKLLEETYPGLFGFRAADEAEGSETSLLDFAALLKSSQTISGEISLHSLLEKLMHIAIEIAGAQKGFLLLDRNGKLVIVAEGGVDTESVMVLRPVPVEQSPGLSQGIVQYVKRTGKQIVLSDASGEGEFTSDAYITEKQPKSVLCIPVIKQGKLSGVLYLENNLTTNAFTPERIEVLHLLSSQAAISIENALLYEEMIDLNMHLQQEIQERMQAEKDLRVLNETLEQRVRERTDEILEANRSLQREIGERKQTEIKLLNEKSFSDSVMNSLPGIFYLFDKNGHFLRWNQNFENITGYTREEIKAMHPLNFFEDKEQANINLKIQEVFGAGSASIEAFLLSKNGTKTPYHFTGFRMEIGNESILIGTGMDISELKNAEEKIKYLAYYDSLTGLPNRRLFRDRIDQTLKLASRFKRLIALLFVDLDNFKQINDSLGHDIGDLMLKKVALLLQKAVRSSDTITREVVSETDNLVMRQGGDEFILLLTEISHADDAAKVAERILGYLSEPFVFGKDEIIISASIGISIYPHDGKEMDTLLKNADTAMYHAKEQGKNNFKYFKQSMHDAVYKKLILESHLRKALDREEFLLYYQPQIDMKTGRVIGLEALIRWQNPDMGMISPDQFIPLAEETGLILPIGDWVINRACAQQKAWQAEGIPLVPVSVNLSSKQFQNMNVIRSIPQSLEDSGLRPQHLMLEITESILMKNIEATFVTVHELSRMGFRFILDDFGTGYSSLGYLKKFPIYAIKIDKSFVQGLSNDSDDEAITNAIISMAHSMNMKVTAEGVETEQQLEYLHNHACDEAQGYLFSKPLPAEETTALLIKEKEEAGIYTHLVDRSAESGQVGKKE